MEPDRTFKIVIAYENFDEAIHAKEMSERVAAHMESECDAWPFELLGVESVREHAVKTAAAADMIIIAAHGAAELPVPVMHWIECALLQRANNPVALVTLLNDDWLISAKPPPLCAGMRRFAERKDVNLFCNLGQPWLRDAAEIDHQFPNPALRMPEEVVPAYSYSRQSGIND